MVGSCIDMLSSIFGKLKSKYPVRVLSDISFGYCEQSYVDIDIENGLARICIESEELCELEECVLVHEYMHVYLFEVSKITFYAKVILSERAKNFVEKLFLGSIDAETLFATIQDIALLLFIKNLNDPYIIKSQEKLFRRAIEAYIAYLKRGEINNDRLGYDLINLVFFMATAKLFSEWVSQQEKTKILGFWRKYSRNPQLDMYQKTLISAVLSATRELTINIDKFIGKNDVWYDLLDFLVDTTINLVARKLNEEDEIAFYVENIKIRNQQLLRILITTTRS